MRVLGIIIDLRSGIVRIMLCKSRIKKVQVGVSEVYSNVSAQSTRGLYINCSCSCSFEISL
jgi:hypothetical protein